MFPQLLMKMIKKIAKTAMKRSFKRKTVLLALDFVVTERMLNKFLSEKNTKMVMRVKKLRNLQKSLMN